MSAEDFHSKDETMFEISTIKRVFSEIYYQQGVDLFDSGEKIDFILGEKCNYCQIGNAYVHFELTLQKDGDHF